MPKLKLLPKLFLSVVAFAACANLFPLQAQQANAQDEQPVIQDVQGLRLQIAQHTQDPYTKEVRLDVVVYSQITSDRVQVVWSVNGVSKLLNPAGGVVTLSVQPNQYYVTSAVILPQGLGNTQIVARVQAFQADGTYISTASKNIGSLGSRDVFSGNSFIYSSPGGIVYQGHGCFVAGTDIAGNNRLLTLQALPEVAGNAIINFQNISLCAGSYQTKTMKVV